MSAIHLLDESAAPYRSTSTSVLQSVRAEGSVQGLLFELSVEQCYLNASDDNIEAVYTFPVSWNAVLLGVECVLGDKVLQGTVVAKADGEQQYETALEEGNSAVMVERAGDGLYTVNVGNLLPGERAIVRFKYAQLLAFEQGHIRLVVPTTLGPRYGKPHSVGLQAHQVPPHDLAADYAFALSITIHGAMAKAVLSSPSHPLSMLCRDGSVTLSLQEAARLDRDVVVVADGLAGKSLATLGRDADGYVALASFCPPASAQTRAKALRLKILVDCSGSMQGDRIDAARRAMHEVFSHLEPEDQFTFSRFGSDVSHCTGSLLSATARAIMTASDWIAATQADMGGTEIAKALLSTYALAQPTDADILLVTDGDVWEADHLIASATQANQRIFAVGIGSAPAASLLQALARRTGGACECVSADSEIAGAILRMFYRMRQAPVREVTVSWKGEPSWQSSPGAVVLSGETLHQVAGFAQTPSEATLSWIDEAGSAHRETVAIDAPLVEGSTLARVAAATRLLELAPAERHALALQYGLVSQTTNLVLVHERSAADKPDTMPTLQHVAHAVPAGWGGLGTVRQGTFNSPASATLHASTNTGPAVWRREQTSAMFRVAQAACETYDIPAFLRKQVPASEPAAREKLRRVAEALAPTSGDSPKVPASLDELAAQLPEQLVEKLQTLIDAGFIEAEVLRALVDALLKHFYSASIARRLRHAIQRLSAKKDAKGPDLASYIESLVLETVEANAPDQPNELPAWLRRATD